MAFKNKQELKTQLAEATNTIIHKPQKKWRGKIEDLIDVFIDSVYDMSQYIAKTQFDERIVTNKRVQFTILPQGGTSRLRNTFVSSSGASATFDNGELRLSTGSDPSASIEVRTRRTGEYTAGSELECGIGIRLEELTGSQVAEWGYFNGEDGFGWEYRADGGWFTFTEKGGTRTYVSQSNWTDDKLDGTTDSGIDLDPTTGSVYLNKFAWYGYGDDYWNIAKTLPGKDIKNRFSDIRTVTRLQYHDEASIYNPQLPITARIKNNGTSGSNANMYVGGRQVSIYSSFPSEPRRELYQNVDNYTIQTPEDVFDPIIAIRPTPTFQGQKNGINIRVREILSKVDNDAEIKVVIDPDLSGTTWATADSYDSNESAAEVALTSSIVTGSNSGYNILPYIYAVAARGSQETVVTEEITQPVIGLSGSILVLAKPATANNTVLNLTLGWTENF